MSDIRALIEAVEAGTVGWNRIATIAEAVMPIREAQIAANAYNGSVDAALALHNALLPNNEWKVEEYDSAWQAEIPVSRPRLLISACSEDNPARAWLLAILRAKEASHDRT